MRSRTPKLRRALPKNTGVRCPSRNAARSKGLQASCASATSSRQASASSGGSSAGKRRIVRTRDRRSAPRRCRCGARGCGARSKVPAKLRPWPIGQVTGAVSSASVFSISSRRSKGSRALAVELVDEGDDRDVAQPADLEELAGARLDALGGVDHHDGGIDRRQRPVGVLREVLVARRVEQVEDAVAVLEGHHRGHDRDAALLLDAHPVGAGRDAVPLGLHLAGELDRAAEQQQLLGQRGLARVRVRDDRKGAAAAHRGRKDRSWLVRILRGFGGGGKTPQRRALSHSALLTPYWGSPVNNERR